MDDDAKKVLEAMKKAGKPVRPGDLAKELAMESKEVSKLIQQLKKEGARFLPQEVLLGPGGMTKAGCAAHLLVRPAWSITSWCKSSHEP